MLDQLIISYRVSKSLQLAIYSLHLLAAIVLVQFNLILWAKVLSLLSVVGSIVIFTLKINRLKGVQSVIVSTDGIAIRRKENPQQLLPASINNELFVTPWLSLLTLKCHDNQSLCLHFLHDNIDREAFRRLRVYLRCLSGPYRTKPQ